jgi:hypothetical protein
MENWVCRVKLVPRERGKPDGQWPDFPDSFIKDGALGGWEQYDRKADRVYIRFPTDLLPKERAEMLKRGNVPAADEKNFVPAPPRRSDGIITGLSIDGVTRIADAREVSSG